MKNLLKSEYPAFWGVRIEVGVKVDSFSELFSLHDDKACNACKIKNCSSKVVLQLVTNAKVNHINIEDFFTQFDNTKASVGKCCDGLLYDDNNRIVFFEMSCGFTKYIVNDYISNGKQKECKRAKAYQQIYSTIEQLNKVPAIKKDISSFIHKVGLFAWRDPHISSSNLLGKAINNFMKPSEIITNSLLFFTTDMGNGFKFIERKYPDVYKWD